MINAMKRRSVAICTAIGIAGTACFTLPIWGMAPAVFLDSQRTVIARSISPDGRRVAQVERLVVGGVPNIVVMVRSSRAPDWYLVGCAAASHHGETDAALRWTSGYTLEISQRDGKFWQQGYAPFHDKPCPALEVTFRPFAA